MQPAEFVAKWARIQQKERATAQSHFNDVCALVGHPTPLAADPVQVEPTISVVDLVTVRSCL